MSTVSREEAAAETLGVAIGAFVAQTPGVTEALVVSSDGFVLAGLTDDHMPGVEQLAAVISALMSLTKGAASLYQMGEVRQIHVEMADGFLFVTSTGAGSTIGALTNTDCNMAELGYELTLLSDRVAALLTPALIDTLKNALKPAHRS